MNTLTAPDTPPAAPQGVAGDASPGRAIRQRRVAVVEDHLLQRQHTMALLAAEPGLKVVHSCDSFPEFLAWYGQANPLDRPNLLILDLMVDRGPSADPTRVATLINLGVRVLVLSAFASPALVRAMLRAGVQGFVGKRDDPQDITAAVWTILDDRPWVTPELAGVIAGDPARPQLSDQEERTLVLYASGLTLPAVAAALGVRPDTAKKYLDRVKAKYAASGREVRTKVDLHREAHRDGFIRNISGHRIRP